MGLTATYVDSTTFTISGDQTDVFESGQKVKLTLVPGGSVYSTVYSASYSAGSGLTTVELLNNVVTADLEEAQYMGAGSVWEPESWRTNILSLPRMV